MSSEILLTYKKEMIKSFSGWKFWDYVSAVGNNMIEEWLQKEVSEDGRLTFDKLLKNIRNTENHRNWIGLRPKPFKRKSGMIWELGFFADGRQYRILGDFCGEKEAVFLIGCYHKQKRYYPEDTIDQAFKRKGELKNGTAKHDERKVPVN
jgi:hypothetical protein